MMLILLLLTHRLRKKWEILPEILRYLKIQYMGMNLYSDVLYYYAN